MHIEYNNYTVKCVYIYIYFLYIYQDIFALKLAVVISYSPSPPKKETPRSTAGLREEITLWKAWEQQHLYTWDPCFGKVSHRTIQQFWQIASMKYNQQLQERRGVTSKVILFYTGTIPAENLQITLTVWHTISSLWCSIICHQATCPPGTSNLGI